MKRMARKIVKSVRITNAEAIKLVNQKANSENRTGANAATCLILEASQNNNTRDANAEQEKSEGVNDG